MAFSPSSILVFSSCLSHLTWHIIAYGKAQIRVSYHHLSLLPQKQFYLSPKVILSKYEEQKQSVTEQVDHVNKEKTFDSDNFTLCAFCEDIYQPCLDQNLGQKYQYSIGIIAKGEQHRVMNNTLGRKNRRCLFLLYLKTPVMDIKTLNSPILWTITDLCICIASVSMESK